MDHELQQNSYTLHNLSLHNLLLNLNVNKNE